MTKYEELAEKKSALEALVPDIEADNEEALTKGAELKADIEKIEKEIEAAEQKASLLDFVGTKEEDMKMGETNAKNIGENFVEQVKAKGADKKFNIIAPEYVKASTDVQVTPSASGVSAYATTYDRNVVEAARTPLVIRDLFAAETISGSTLAFLKEGAIQGAPAATNEAAKKPQVHFADPTLVTVTLGKIACFIKESDEYIHDYPFLASAINGRLLYQLGLVEQNTLVSALTGTSGIQTDSSSWTASSEAIDIADLILDAAMDVQEQSGFAADGIVLNPATWYMLRVAKKDDGTYYGGGFFGSQDIPNLWGIPVCVTTAVTASQIIVGAFKACGSVVTSGGISVEATNTDQDDFVKNLMTIRAEERLALAVRRPAGFKLLTKAA